LIDEVNSSKRNKADNESNNSCFSGVHSIKVYWCKFSVNS